MNGCLWNAMVKYHWHTDDDEEDDDDEDDYDDDAI